MNNNLFECLSLSPASLQPAAIAIATARAGGTGLLDCEYCNDLAIAEITLASLLSAVSAHQQIGLRLRVTQLSTARGLLDLLAGRPHCLLLSADDKPSFNKTIASLPASDSRRLLIEVNSVDLAKDLSGMKIDGLVARGHEAAGWSGEDTSFILTQKITALQQEHPVFIHGGIGIHTAAACKAAGAAGIILDDQLLLMPESPLPAAWRQHLETLSGQEATAIGEQVSCVCRVLSRPGFRVIDELRQLANTAEIEGWPTHKWRERASELIGWGAPGDRAWPVGQSIGLAAALRDRYKTTGRLIHAVLHNATQNIADAKSLTPLAPGSALAESHGTRYPVVQGPMTRVSDKAEFADAVSRAGGLPMLALALMRGEQVAHLLQETRALLQDRPWGVGLLGFVPEQLREEQVAAINEVKPAFALIAGGRPDQAAEFEKRGIATYLHAPAPQLLKMFIEQGARRFIFEGRECGGHVGPLSSFVLWEHMINALLNDVPAGAEKDMHILFAGGIHDARSAAMVASMAAPLAKRGMRIGVLMGTAYLFTEQIVSSGTIVRGFQEQALSCERTINLETGPGHASRCSVTPFAREFFATRRRLLAEGESAETIKNTLEDLNLGRLRIASKGIVRGESGIHDVDADEQLLKGMYMIGQVATMRKSVVDIEELHRDVSVVSTDWLDQLDVDASRETSQYKPADIAVIGIGTLLPGAQQGQKYWENIINKINVISEIPAHRWDWRLYFDEDRNARDKVYSRWGGFLDEVPFDPMRFGIPPNSLKSIEPMQLLALEVVRRALEDSGYADGEFDRENTSVIFGAGGGLGDLGQQYAVRSEIPHFIENASGEVWDRLPEWTEESFPGALLNVVAGRVANRFNFGGSNFTIDAACASSLAAIKVAVDELESGRSNVAIAGGVDTVQNPFGFLCFSKTKALSPKGIARAFDKNADGIVISEGLAVIVLKRLADAERDGDRIYSVIKAVSSSSDGKALGLTAPLPAGQMRALRRAYNKAGFLPDTLGLIEAHGTGTVVGDTAEIQTVTRTLREHNTPAKSCVIGSVKTMIGHTKATAGVAGLIKVVLSLHHKVLPPHMGVDAPVDPIAEDSSPVYLLKEPRAWLSHPDYPRRAGVSAFGFGGTNFHAVLEEYTGEYRQSAEQNGAISWPCELLLFRAGSRELLVKELVVLRTALQAGAEPRMQDLAWSYAQKFEAAEGDGVAAAIIAEDLRRLSASLDALIDYCQGDSRRPLPPHVICQNLATDEQGKIAFLFPGQGAQYPDMARESAMYLPEIRQALEVADCQLRDSYARRLSDYIYPPSAFSDADSSQQQMELTNTHIAQPSIGALSSGFLDFARRLGLRPDMTAGHSYGEYTALYAAGVLSREDFLMLSETRGRVMAQAQTRDDDAGTMAVVQLVREQVEARLANYDGVVIANHNAPQQTVISGATDAVKQLVEQFERDGITARLLPVSGAFHSELMASAQEPLAKAIRKVKAARPSLPVYGNSTAAPYDNKITSICDQLSNHLLSSVEFVGQINAMYAAGARTFIELGPKSILSNLVGQILEDREHTAVALDGQAGGMRGVLIALAKLATGGIGFDLAALFANRYVQKLDLQRLAETTRPKELPATTWLVDGGCARRQTEPKGQTGKLPSLQLESREAARLTYLEKHAPAPVPQTGPSATTATSVPVSHSAPAAMAAPIAAAPSPQRVSAVDRSLSNEALAGYQETMRQFLALQERVIIQFLGGTSSDMQAQQTAAPQVTAPPAASAVSSSTHTGVAQASGTQSTTTTPTPQPAAEQVALRAAAAVTVAPTKEVPAASGMDRKAVSSLLVDLVSDRTGYPADMLGMDLDLEAELGIDSIKRVEIVGALQKQLPAVMAEGMQANMAELTRVKSLNALLDKLAISDTPAPAGTTTTARTDITTPATLTAAVATTAPAAASGMDRKAVSSLLVDLVSDRTGYPADMLGMDLDLEAELGIDSIKRVEIVGALQKQLPAVMAEGMQANMAELTRVKSLNALLDKLAISDTPAPVQIVTATMARTKLTTLAIQTAAVVTTAPAAASGMDRAAVSSLLIDIVSERTGYPADMLGMDLDLEAELGIDSIKRVEIVGALQKQLPTALAEGMQANMAELTRVKSLNALLDKLDVAATTKPVVTAQQPVPAVAEAPASYASQQADSVPRFVMEGRAEELPIATEFLAGLYLITEDGLGVAPLVAQELGMHGVTAVVLNAEVLRDNKALDTYIAELRNQHGPVAGILHLAGLAKLETPRNLAEWRNYSYLHTKSLFHLMKLCGDDLQQLTNSRVLVASLFGGHYGRDGKVASGLATVGGGNGLVKTMVQEWAGVTGRLVDFDKCLTAAQVANAIYKELLGKVDNIEVGYPQGQRTVFYTVQAPLDDQSEPQLAPADDWVTLVTAGARGITAEIASEFARPGMKFVVLGRTPEPGAEAEDTAAITDIAQLRMYLLKNARNSGVAATPVMIEKQLIKLVREREIRDNLAHFAQAGAEVIYRDVDVRSEESFGTLIEGIYDQYGRLDAVLHGAGIIEDKLIEGKTEESFDRVFDTKADSCFLLSRYLRPETLKVVLLFTSVAGRYGNHGQSDYAAANEVVNRLAWQMDQQWPNARIMAINWGPWDTTGMASEGVKRQFRERGIVPIPVAAGRRFFLDELCYGRKGDVELVAGEGPWQEGHMQPPSANIKVPLPLLLAKPTMEPNGTISMEHRFTLANDPYLTDHRLDNKPVLPVAAAAEWIAEFVQAAWSDWVVAEVRDLTVMRGLKFNADGVQRVMFIARASSHADPNSLQVSAEIVDVNSKLPYYKASVILRPELEETPDVHLAPLTAGIEINVDQAYRDFLFHGPHFQLIDAISSLHEDGIDAIIRPSRPASWLKGRGHSWGMSWLFDPGMLDTPPQLAIVWSRINRGSTALPSRFGSVVRYGNGPIEGPLTLMMRMQPTDNDVLLHYDAVFVDQAGKVRIRMQNIESACNEALNRLAATP